MLGSEIGVPRCLQVVMMKRLGGSSGGTGVERAEAKAKKNPGGVRPTPGRF